MLLSFNDVTDECAALGYERGCPLAEVVVSAQGGTNGPPFAPPPPPWPSPSPAPPPSPSPAAPPPPPSLPPPTASAPEAGSGEGAPSGRRQLAEGGGGGGGGGGGVVAAEATPHATITYEFHYANGAAPMRWSGGKLAPRHVVVTVRKLSARSPAGRLLGLRPVCLPAQVGATIAFNTGVCWYLDSTFCSGLHGMKQAMGADTAFTVFALLLYGLFGLTWIVLTANIGWLLYQAGVCGGGRKSDRGPLARGSVFKRLEDRLSRCSITALTLYLTLLWAPPIIHTTILLPCWECFDFEAAATHEVGHVLGLWHPDEPLFGANLVHAALANGTRMAAGGCAHPWDDVREAAAGAPAAPAIMERLTQNNPKVCLAQDDLDALNTLYPDCERAISSPVCLKSQHYIGWVRLLVWVGVPVLLTLLAGMVFAACARRYQKEVLRKAQAVVVEQQGEIKAAHKAETEARRRATLAQAGHDLRALSLTPRQHLPADSPPRRRAARRRRARRCRPS